MNEEGTAAVGPGVVTGVIGADVHAVGNRILEYALPQAGRSLPQKQAYRARGRWDAERWWWWMWAGPPPTYTR